MVAAGELAGQCRDELLARVGVVFARREPRLQAPRLRELQWLEPRWREPQWLELLLPGPAWPGPGWLRCYTRRTRSP